MVRSMNPETPIIALVGPTAVGKTRLALDVALELDAEIVSIDSMQVYRGMDAGTSKPSPEDREMVPFHLLDVVDTATGFSVARFKDMADDAMADIVSRGKTPFLVGGSGLYYRAVADDLDFANVSGSELFRVEVREELEDMTTDELYELLKEEDGRAAEEVGRSNRRRVIRALEVARCCDRLMSERQHSWSDFSSPYDLIAAGLEMERDLLYHLIDSRVDSMFENGLESEVRSLRSAGLERGTTAGEALGYKQVLGYLDGEMTLAEAVREIKKRTRNYAKRQLTWFKKDPRIEWFKIGGTPEDPPEELDEALRETRHRVLEYFRSELENQ